MKTMPHRSGVRRQVVPAIGALGLLLALGAGCGRGPGLPRTAADVPGYTGAPPSLAGVDAAPLSGRRILVDPGHGGVFRGAVGPGGLSEAEINLGVALYLQGLLRWAGAEAHLTRSADVDFLTPADSSLAADLAARVAICDSLAPDVFLSIHHNSTADRDPHINETQTYYPIGREGADLDLARAIHRRLVLGLDIRPARILPGGFHVLRNVSVPAVLGEPAMLSHPVIEQRLGLARSLELEAAAYFLGLRDYFAAGTPVWRTALPDTVDLTETTGPLIWTFDAGSPGSPGLDPATLAVTLDGRPLAAHLDAAAGAVSLLPPTEAADGGRLELAVRNLAGRATPGRAHLLRHRRDGPWRTHWILDGEDRRPRRALYTYRNEGRDLDLGGALRLSSATGAALDGQAGSRPLPVHAGRRGWLLVEPPLPRPDDLRILERDGGGGWLVHAESAPSTLTLPPGSGWQILAVDRATWPDRHAPGAGWRSRYPLGDGEMMASLAACGFSTAWPAVPRLAGRPLWLEADGAHPLVVTGSPADTLIWKPLLPALVGRRVVLDPRGGGAEEQGRGPFGTRGSDLNLQTAGRLAALLRAAGCEVLMLREDDTWTPDPVKVLMADRFGAHLYLAIGRGAPGVRHHPASPSGAPLAARCAEDLARLLRTPVPVSAAYDYVLRHTACPAVVIDLEPPAAADQEDRLTAPAWLDAEARAMMRGLCALWQPAAEPLAMIGLLADLGERAIGLQGLDLVRLDGNLQWLPPGRGQGSSLDSWQDRDPGLPVLGGRHVLELRAGPLWQLWTIDRQAEGGWHGQLRLENR